MSWASTACILAEASRQHPKDSTVNRILIIADDREVVSGVPDLLAQMPEVELRSGRLVVGDYRIEESALIERKAASDFAQSLVTGRLFEQAARMERSDLRPAYILEGAICRLGGARRASRSLARSADHLDVDLRYPRPACSRRVGNGAADPLCWTATGSPARSAPRALSSGQGQTEADSGRFGYCKLFPESAANAPGFSSTISGASAPALKLGWMSCRRSTESAQEPLKPFWTRFKRLRRSIRVEIRFHDPACSDPDLVSFSACKICLSQTWRWKVPENSLSELP